MPKLVISGVDRTSLLQRASLSVDRQLQQASTAQFKLRDLETGYRPQVGEPLYIYSDDGGTQLIFGGSCDQPQASRLLGTYTNEYAIQCVDWHQNADRHIAAKSYSGVSSGSIVQDLITSYLAQDGITAGDVQAGPTISTAVFNYIPVSQALDQLSKLTGFQWRINPDKSLDWFDQSTYSAPWSLTETSPVMNLTVTGDRSYYRNKQFIRAGTKVSDPQIVNRTGDGKTRTWTLPLPLAKQPTITLNGAAQTTGVGGVESGVAYYYNIGSQTITQDDTGTLLANTDDLQITFQGRYPIVVVAQSSSEVASRAAVEENGGVYDSVASEPNINDDQTALEYAQGLLRRYAHIYTDIEFDTRPGAETDLNIGQVLQVDLASSFGYQGEILVSEVTWDDPVLASGTLRQHVKALGSEAFGGWTYFFKQLAQGQQSYVISDNEILITLKVLQDSLVLTDSLAYSALPLTSMLYGGLATFGGRSYDEVILADRPVGYWRLDETSGTIAHDSSGNGNNGTITGGVTLGVQGPLASTDTAMAFDGSTGYISVPASPYISPSSNALSVEAWIKTTISGIIANQENAFEIAVIGGQFQMALMTTNMNGAVPSAWFWFGPTTLVNDGVYHLLSAAYDGSDVRLYIDGQLSYTETNYTGPVQKVTTPLGIACRGLGVSGPNSYFPGSLDEVAIYGYALTAAQVAAHYAAGSWRVATLTQTDALARAGSLILAKNGTPYYASGTAQTPTIDLTPAAAIPGASLTVQWSECLPVASVSATVQLRFSVDGATWGAWQPVTQGQALTAIERYAQALVTLTTSDTAQTPQFNWLRLAVATPAKWDASEWQS